MSDQTFRQLIRDVWDEMGYGWFLFFMTCALVGLACGMGMIWLIFDLLLWLHRHGG